MIEPIRMRSSIKPESFVDLGSGNWYYNYDINSESTNTLISSSNDDSGDPTIYNFIQIKVSGKPDYKKCTELIIREHITQSQEFDLINSYNRALLGTISEDEVKKALVNYTDYLNKIAEIKSKIKKDFEQQT